MKTKFKFLATMLIGILLSTNVWGEEATWTLVEEEPTDWSGEYIVVYEGGCFDGSLTSEFDQHTPIVVTVSDNKITLDDQYAMVVARSGEKYSFKTASGFYIGRNTNSNGMDASQTWSTNYTVTFGSWSSTNKTIKIAGNGGRTLGKNGSSWRFYASSNTYTNLQLYKKDAPADFIETLYLWEAGVRSENLKGTYRVGGKYTLPSTVEITCGDKILVGWSTEELPSEGTRPTSNYYDKGAQVTLEANNTFYAVFADVSGDPDNFVKGSQSSLTEGQIVVIHDNTNNNALTTDGYADKKIPGTSITPSNNKIPTTSITDGMKWTVGVVNGKYTFRQGSNYLMAGSMYLEFGTTQTEWELESVSGGYKFIHGGSYPYIGYLSNVYDIVGTTTIVLNVFVPDVSYANYTTSCATYTVTWKVNNATYEAGGSTTAPGGGKVSALPTAPTPAGGCVGSVFVGWTDHEVLDGEAPTPLFKTVADAPVVTGDVIYHAVFAEENE